MWRLGPRKLPSGIEFMSGSSWVFLNKEFVSYVVGGNDELLNGLLKKLETSIWYTQQFLQNVVDWSYFQLSSKSFPLSSKRNFHSTEKIWLSTKKISI